MYYSITVLQYYTITVLQYYSIIVLQYYSVIVLQHYSTIVLQSAVIWSPSASISSSASAGYVRPISVNIAQIIVISIVIRVISTKLYQYVMIVNIISFMMITNHTNHDMIVFVIANITIICQYCALGAPVLWRNTVQIVYCSTYTPR